MCQLSVKLPAKLRQCKRTLMLDGAMYPSKKLECFALKEETNVNKTPQLIPLTGAAILGVMQPHAMNILTF
jgi:hypothetical protein